MGLLHVIQPTTREASMRTCTCFIGLTHSPSCSLTYLLACSLTHSLGHPSIHTHLPTHTPTHLPSHPPIWTPTHPYNSHPCSPTHLHLQYSPTHPNSPAFKHLPIHPCPPFCSPTYPPVLTHTPICTSTHSQHTHSVKNGFTLRAGCWECSLLKRNGLV